MTQEATSLPAVVLDLLQDTSLCFLATTQHDTPHLSLMNFTWVPEERVIVLSSRKDSQKYLFIKENPHVSILLHNFGPNSNQKSVTLNGRVFIQEGDREIFFRNLHLAKNANFKQFILGENIAILTFSIDTARICDIYDHVTTWKNPEETS